MRALIIIIGILVIVGCGKPNNPTKPSFVGKWSVDCTTECTTFVEYKGSGDWVSYAVIDGKEITAREDKWEIKEGMLHYNYSKPTSTQVTCEYDFVNNDTMNINCLIGDGSTRDAAILRRVQ